MDIPALSMALSQTKALSDIGMAVLFEVSGDGSNVINLRRSCSVECKF